MLNRSVLRLMTASVIALGIGTPRASAQPAPTSIEVPAVPAGLEVPAGNLLYLAGRAVGTQNYICVLTPGGLSWRFLAPQATLFDGLGIQQLTTHFLSANPSEDGRARPTWQHSVDSSQVWGKLRASSTDPAFVQAGAIPWLLLEVAGTATGPGGGALLAETTFIHRLNTSGGVAPATGCTRAADVGTLALVPYTTDYFFYKAGL